MPHKFLNRKLFHRATFVFSLFMLVVAIFALHEALDEYTYAQIVHELGAIRHIYLMASVLLTALSYALMTLYDRLALAYLGVRLAFSRVALASFVSYAIGNNAGQMILSGGAIRLRTYSAYGLTPLQIAKIIGFTALTFWVGVFALAGAAFLLDPLPLPTGTPLPFRTSFPAGVVLILLVAGYLAVTWRGPGGVRLFGHWVSLPKFRIAFSQVAVSAFDMMLSCGAFYLLLPANADLTFTHFLGIYMLAMLLGLVSMLPGGLGVFEMTLVVLLKPFYTSSVLLGAIIAFRLIYYLLPLAVAALALLAFESRAIRRLGYLRWLMRIKADSEVVEEAAGAFLGSGDEAAKFDVPLASREEFDGGQSPSQSGGA